MRIKQLKPYRHAHTSRAVHGSLISFEALAILGLIESLGGEIEPSQIDEYSKDKKDARAGHQGLLELWEAGYVSLEKGVAYA